MPTGIWRAPVANAVAWVVQSFLDKLAHASGQDPLSLRITQLGAANRMHAGGLLSRAAGYRVDRMRAVHQAVAERGGWGVRCRAAKGRGLRFTTAAVAMQRNWSR